MDLLGIIFITLLIAGLVFLAVWGINYAIYSNIADKRWREKYMQIENKWFLTWLIALIIGICAWVGFIFVGLTMNENSHKVYAQKYIAQKQTIEMSLENDNLSGLERIELVKQATELNGELAERKTNIKFWYSGVLDNTIYDNIEFIKLN